jgi:hypothetical protein
MAFILINEAKGGMDGNGKSTEIEFKKEIDAPTDLPINDIVLQISLVDDETLELTALKVRNGDAPEPFYLNIVNDL